MSIAHQPPMGGPPDANDPYPLSSDDFFRMVELGLIPADRRVFLRDGRLYEKMAKTVAHAATAVAIQEALRRRLPPGWLLWPENPIRLDDRNAPLPDIPVVRGPLDRYLRADRHPEAGDVGLLVEIAVTSPREDLGASLEQYARALVPAYWVADVRGRRILAHRLPRVEGGRGLYDSVEPYAPGQAVPLALDGREIAAIPVEELLP